MLRKWPGSPARKPERIRIKTVGSAASLEQVLRQYGVAEKRLEEHAILNGMALNNPLAKGTLIKVVGQ
jgi:hypothetical protein